MEVPTGLPPQNLTPGEVSGRVRSAYRRCPLTHRLSLTNALADADIDRQKAERIATEIFDAIHNNVATKQDVQRLETALTAGLAAVRTEIELAKHQLFTRLGGLIVIVAGIVLAVLRY